MADELFKDEDPLDEEGRNPTQQQIDEEGSAWKPVGPAGTEGAGPPPGAEEDEEDL